MVVPPGQSAVGVVVDEVAARAGVAAVSVAGAVVGTTVVELVATVVSAMEVVELGATDSARLVSDDVPLVT